MFLVIFEQFYLVLLHVEPASVSLPALQFDLAPEEGEEPA